MSKPNPGYAHLLRTLAAQTQRHRQTNFLGLAAVLIAAAGWAYSTGQTPLVLVALCALLVGDLAWLGIQRARFGKGAIERFVEQPDQVAAIEHVRGGRAEFLRLRLGTGETVDLKVPARQAATVARQLKGHCRLASVQVR